jgi:hypothetical protein
LCVILWTRSPKQKSFMARKTKAGTHPAESTHQKIIVAVGKLESEVMKSKDPQARLQLLLSCMHLRKEAAYYLE